MTSLPVPDSPWSRTVASVGATSVARLIASAQPAECPTTKPSESCSDGAVSRDLIARMALMACLLPTTLSCSTELRGAGSALRRPRDGVPRRQERLRSFHAVESSPEEWRQERSIRVRAHNPERGDNRRDRKARWRHENVKEQNVDDDRSDERRRKQGVAVRQQKHAAHDLERQHDRHVVRLDQGSGELSRKRGHRSHRHKVQKPIEPEDNEHESQYETGNGCYGLHGGAPLFLSGKAGCAAVCACLGKWCSSYSRSKSPAFGEIHSPCERADARLVARVRNWAPLAFGRRSGLRARGRRRNDRLLWGGLVMRFAP